MDIIRHPIVISLAFGTLGFVVASYYNPPTQATQEMDKIGKYNKKSKQNVPQKEYCRQKEINVGIGIAIAIIVWFVVRHMYGTATDPQEKVTQKNTAPIKSLSSDSVKLSYNLLGTGLKLPTTELPPVLIEYK